MNIIIRQETQDNLKAIHSLIKEAFNGAEHSDGKEQGLAVKLRAGQNFIPALAIG